METNEELGKDLRGKEKAIFTNFADFLDSPEGKASLQAFADEFAEKKKILRKRLEKVKVYVEKVGIHSIMERLVNEHDETWREHCYLNGYEPYENNKLHLLLEFVMEYGQTSHRHRSKIFSNHTWVYGDFYFNLMHGQGSVWSIYYKSECIY